MTESKFNVNEQEGVKIFSDLKEEVINKGLCCACGACVTYCECQGFDVIELFNDQAQFKSSANEKNCTECGVCYFICPQTNVLLDKLYDFYSATNKLGKIINIIAAKTTDKIIEKFGQDGGVVSSILMYLFDRNKIDAAVVSAYDDNFKPQPILIFNKDDLVKTAGTRYSISSQIIALKDLYQLPMDIISEKKILDIDSLRVAFVGTPCQCRAISKMKMLNIKPAHVIKYVISLFCFENFNYKDLYNLLEKKTGITPKNIKKTWIKKNFFIQSKDDKIFEVPIKELNNAVRSHCHECDEFTGKFSDISVGASGAPKGYSMIVIRTEIGKNLIENSLASNYIEQLIIPSNEMPEWKQKRINQFNRLLSLKTKK
ncbi:MAG: Coenzyme F420 hydrogenase/dehydrogenase, beta subunit C-terminal domain [Promethearchaeia archaeon]